MRSRPAALAVLLFLSATAHRAQTTGTIEGRVENALGTPIPAVTVDATSPRLQRTLSATSDGDGRFRMSSLPPGNYVIRVALAGYRPVEKEASVSLDARVSLSLVLEPAAADEIVVRGKSSPIDTTSTTGGTSYSASVISALPVSRNYADIVRSNPGVGTDRGDTLGGRALALTVYGSTSSENQWLIDGLNTTSVIRGTQGKAINNEFVEEVQVKTGGYPAEYGGATGGVVNVVTKSGGNTFHGDGFLYYDSDGTTAEPRIDEGDSIYRQVTSLGLRTDFGADLGGYVLKDRLWFFAAYNRVEVRNDVSRADTVGEVTPEDKFPLDTTGDLYSAKLTWNVTPSTSVVGTVFSDPSIVTGATTSAPVSLAPSTWFTHRDIGGTDYGGRLTQLLGAQAIVTLQGGLHKDRYELDGADLVRTEDWTCSEDRGPNDPCPGHVPNSVSGGFGLAAARYDRNASTRQQYRADATLYAGNHELKAGGAYQNGTTQGLSFFSGGQRVYIYNDVEGGRPYYAHDYFAVSPSDPTSVLPDYRPSGRTIGFAAYASDSWRPSAGVTVNAGLRWDGQDIEDLQGLTRLRSRDQWQPRLGVVWAPGSSGRTKLSAFAGRFAYDMPTILAIAAYRAGTYLRSYNYDPLDVTPDPSVPEHDQNPAVLGGGGVVSDPADEGIGLAYQDELSLGVEHAFDPTLVVELKGVYRRLGRALEDRCDFVTTGLYNSCALINPGSGERYAAGDAPSCEGFDNAPECSATGAATPPARRTYRGIEILARKSLGQTFWAQASYVYSSLLGNFDGAVNSNGNIDIATTSDFNYSALWHNGYGALALDRTHRFRVDGYWSSPWQLAVGLQFFVETGAPLDRLGYFNRVYGSAVRLVPRGSAGRLPTLWEANLSLAYPITFGPLTATIQAYLFNVFNNQIATATDTAWTLSAPDGYPDTWDDPYVPSDNAFYGTVTQRYAPRSFRAALRISF